MIIGKPVIKFAVMDEEMQHFAVEKAQEALLVMFHEQVSAAGLTLSSKSPPT